VKASEIADLVGGSLFGGDRGVSGVAPLDRSRPDDLSFVASARYLSQVAASQAGALLVARDLADRLDDPRPRIIVTDVHRALATVLQQMYPEAPVVPGVHASAVLGPAVRMGERVCIGAYAVIGEGSRLGDDVSIGAHTVVGPDCDIGDGVVLHPHVSLYGRVRIGPRSIVHSGARLGVDGFGYVFEDGRHRKVPQVGDCRIGADVEIGANTTIDRGSVGPTIIGDGVKIDNLVHLGHNVRVGELSIVVAQVGVAGSARIGRGVTLGGQVGIPGHIEIGDGATLGAQAGVFGDIPAGATYSGYPARPHREALRAQAALFRLPDLVRRLRSLERAVLGREGAEE
jgi:UDP-3-O-[3-hydroxymyristoyl] glucosamine N-acyltransferase